MRFTRHNSANLHVSTKERLEAGKTLREKVPRSSHSKWAPAKNRPDPIDLLTESDRGKLPELLPIRYARMRASPFAFFRGSASLMAGDLASEPVTGIRVQACGDCHVANFGGFGTPERHLVFDINDFDETLPAPWEWDVHRLAASVVLAMRDAGFGERHCTNAVHACAKNYRDHMHEYAEMSALEVWYSFLNLDVLIQNAKTREAKQRWKKRKAMAADDSSGNEFPKITSVTNGRARIVDRPPLIYHPRGMAAIGKHVRQMFRQYRDTLAADRRIVLDRYELLDVARKVVGVGSVGTRCAVTLLTAGPDDSLVLQYKQATTSVLAPYAGKSRYDNQGERVVTGQRMLQSASDVFLGWTRDNQGHDFYFRQLRDMRMKIDVEEMSKEDWFEYVELCAWALARAHARTGDPARIAGYLGKTEVFDDALAKFAAAYADQTEHDYGLFLKAIRSGRIKARPGAAP